MNNDETATIADKGFEGLLSFLRPWSSAVTEVADDDGILAEVRLEVGIGTLGCGGCHIDGEEL